MPPTPPGRSLLRSAYGYFLMLAGAVWLAAGLRLRPAEIGTARTFGLLAIVGACGWGAQKLFARHARGVRQVRSEALRWSLLLAAALLLTMPYDQPRRVGAGDAQDYAEHLADFISQVRHGVFPVLVGQSRYAFNGAFNPLRTAPYHQYFGGALHALTLGTLNPFAVQNLEVILSLVAAGFTCYLLLQRLEPRRGWLCLGLALLYISSPGVLALIFEGDMLPSWLTLPYLPIVTFLVVRVAEAGASPGRLVALAAAMAAIWWAHAPIAMWLSFLAGPVVLARLLLAPDWRGWVLPLAVALAAFSLLAGYEFVSVMQLGLPALRPEAATIDAGRMTALLGESWKGFFQPIVGDGSHLLRDLQLSPVLWGCLAFGLLGWSWGGWGLRTLVVASLVLLSLMLPLPWLAGRLWATLPAWVCQITDQWPAQRFFPILSALAPFVFLRAWGRTPNGRVRRLAPVIYGGLAIGCLWGLGEGARFSEHGFRATLPESRSRRAIEPQNSVLSLYSYAMLGHVSRYFSFAPVSPDMQLHLLDDKALGVQETNQNSLRERSASGLGAEWRGSFVPSAGGAVLRPDIELQPGWGCLLSFRFRDQRIRGTLVASGENLWREFPLPRAGGERAFGANEEWSTLNLRAPGRSPIRVHLAFLSADGRPVSPPFATLRILPYQVQDLPFHFISLMPYRIRTRTETGGWLETTRIFIPGYRAMVDGKEAEFKSSPDGLVMVRIPPGESEVELDYRGSVFLRASFWISLASWLLIPALWLCRDPIARLWGRATARRPLSPPRGIRSPDAQPVSVR